MVHKKAELSTNSTIECLLPPIPSVHQILCENLKYEQELKDKEKLHKSNNYKKRRKRKGSHTSTKFLPDWINDVQCDWAHSHDFRNYHHKGKKSNNMLNNNQNMNHYQTKSTKSFSKRHDHHHHHHRKTHSLSNGKYNRKHFDNVMDEIELKSNALAPSETSPAFESPAQSPDEHTNNNNNNNDTTPPALDINVINDTKSEKNKKSPIHHYKARSRDDNNNNNNNKIAIGSLLGLSMDTMQKSQSKSKSLSTTTTTTHSRSESLVNTPLTPLNELTTSKQERREAIMHHEPTANDRIISTNSLLKTHGARSRSVSDSNCSDYGLYGAEFEPSLSHSESMPVEMAPDLTTEVTQHLQRINNDNSNNDNHKHGKALNMETKTNINNNKNDNGRGHKKIRSDSMLPSELKKRYKTKIKQIGKSINGDEYKQNNDNNNNNNNNNKNGKKGKKKKLGRKWGRRKKKNKNNLSDSVPQRVIDENREIDNNYFVNNISHKKQVSLTPNSSILSTPSREYSTSTSREDNIYSDDESISLHNNNNNNNNNNNIIKSDEEAILEEIQSTSVFQPKKHKNSGGMFSRIFNKIQIWTDKNRQAFTSYSQILKTAISQQENLIKEYQTELHNCKRQMSSELKRWKRWAQIEAENMARTYYENKYLLLSSQIEISMAKLQILQQIVNKVQFVLDGGDMEKVKHIIFQYGGITKINKYKKSSSSTSSSSSSSSSSTSPFSSPSLSQSQLAIEKKMNKSFSNLPAITSSPTSPKVTEQKQTINDNNNNNNNNNDQSMIEYIFKNPNMLSLQPEINALQEALPTLIDVESKLRIQYESLIKEIMIQQTPSKRGNIYRKIILSGYKSKYLIRSQNYHYHPPDDKGLQVQFNCLLIDDRYPEGKLLRKWRKDIQKKFTKARKLKQKQQRGGGGGGGGGDDNNDNDNNIIISAQDVSDFLQDVTTLILREYPIYQRDDWDPSNLDDKDVTNLNDIKIMHKFGMKYVDTYYVLKLYLDRLVFPRLAFNVNININTTTTTNNNNNNDDDNNNNNNNKIPIWLSLYSVEEKEFDNEFEINCEWMRNLTQSQVSIPNEYQKKYATNKQISLQFNSRLAIKNNMIHPELPYYQAILSFNRAKNVYVPNDMLYCFIEGLRLINSAASEYKYKNDIIKYELNKNNDNNNYLDPIDEKQQIDNFQHNGIVEDIDNDNDNQDIMIDIIRSHSMSSSSSPVKKENVQLSADDLFPILVWIIIHCRINDIYMRLGYLQKFLDDSIKYFGEVGMCLSLVQAAAEFVRKKEGWHFGLDEQLDKDKLNIVDDNADNNNNNNDINDFKLPPQPQVSTHLKANESDIQYLESKYQSKLNQNDKTSTSDNIPPLPPDNNNNEQEVEM